MAAQHPAPGICLLGPGDAPVIYLIYSSVAAFSIQTHLDTGDCTDPGALEGGQGRAPAPEPLTAAAGAARGILIREQGRVTAGSDGPQGQRIMTQIHSS